ncbi:hypothetical protein D3C76_865600 [compost metagenome]|jgi:hypothetical protein
MDNDFERMLETMKQSNPGSDGTFKWRFDSGSDWTEATTARAELWLGAHGKRQWCVYAWTGSNQTNDLVYYVFRFDLIDENIIDKTLNLGEQGLIFRHWFSTNGNAATYRNALSAKVSIKLNPKTGVCSGHFEATFDSNFKSPNGEFNLTSQPVGS